MGWTGQVTYRVLPGTSALWLRLQPLGGLMRWSACCDVEQSVSMSHGSRLSCMQQWCGDDALASLGIFSCSLLLLLQAVVPHLSCLRARCCRVLQLWMRNKHNHFSGGNFASQRVRSSYSPWCGGFRQRRIDKLSTLQGAGLRLDSS